MMEDKAENKDNSQVGQLSNKQKSSKDESNAKKDKLTKDMLVGALCDPTFWALLIANLYSIYVIYVSHASLVFVLLVYWFQIIIISILDVIRILCLKIPVNNLSKSKDGAISTVKKKNVSNAFALLLGDVLFNFFYYFLILMYGSAHDAINSSTFISILPIVMIFLVNHLFSFIYNFKEQTTNQDSDLIEKESIDRIAPLHIALMFIFVLGERLILPFLFLKTYYDVRGHVFKHATLLPHAPKRS